MMKIIDWKKVFEDNDPNMKEEVEKLEETEHRYDRSIKEIPKYKHIMVFMELIYGIVDNYLSLPEWSTYHTDLTFDNPSAVSEHRRLTIRLGNIRNIATLGEDLKENCKRCACILRLIGRYYKFSDFKIINEIKWIIENWVLFLEENGYIPKDNTYRKEIERDLIYSNNDACWR